MSTSATSCLNSASLKWLLLGKITNELQTIKPPCKEYWICNKKKVKWQTKSRTGSFRMNGKSKTVFMGTKFHEKLIFSAFFSRELATNLRPWATRSVTITLWHPENVAPPVWFQALVGCLKPTTDPETLSKDHKGVLWSVRPPLGILWLY